MVGILTRSLLAFSITTRPYISTEALHSPRLHQDQFPLGPELQSKKEGREPDPDYNKKYARYVSFGDSWSSGVNYGGADPKVEYDYPDSKEVCRCRRIVEAWPNQLTLSTNNQTVDGTGAPAWLGGRQIDLDFLACYGSMFEDIPKQLARINTTYAPDFGTLMIGGNPGGFADILINCVYWPEVTKNYGPEFPNNTGECYKTIQKANEIVDSQEFLEQLLLDVSLILTNPMIVRNPFFRLYIISYAELFNADDAACDKLSFGFWSYKKPRLTRDLRKAINHIINKGRRMYDGLFNGPLFGKAVRFIDINNVFDGRRFCEPTANGTVVQQNERSWLWNYERPACLAWMAGDKRERAAGDVLEAESVICRSCGSLQEYGEFLRPFHPRAAGHAAIRDRVIEEIGKDPPSLQGAVT